MTRVMMISSVKLSISLLILYSIQTCTGYGIRSLSLNQFKMVKNRTFEDFAQDCTPQDLINEANPITCTAIEISPEGCDRLPTIESEFAPGLPHGLRVYSYSSTHPTRRENPYQLRANISWEPPYHANQENLTGFNLLLHDLKSDKQRCFVFFLPNSSGKWDERYLDSPPRFRFWTIDIFSWDRKYTLQLYSLPKPRPTPNVTVPCIEYTVPMMKHPANAALERVLVRTKWLEKPLPEGSYNCDLQVNPDGEQWLAGFKKVYVNANDLEIEAEFIAAPPQYCFDAYEVQLADQTHPLVKLQVINVTKDQLFPEQFSNDRNVTVQLGRVVFKNITVGKSYLITVIARERDKKGRCVCMSKEFWGKTDPTEKNIQCHCLGATWPLTPFPENVRMNHTNNIGCVGNKCVMPAPDGQGSIIVLLVMLGVAVMALAAAATILILFWNHYKKKANDPFTRVRFKPGPGKSTTTSGSHLPLFSLDTTLESLELNGSMKVQFKNVLIVYSHDSPEHDACVEALARYLKTNCNCRVSMDTWCMQSIANNKIDWVYKSMKEADKVILVNSEAAYYRYQAKLSGGEVFERVDHVPCDDLFLMQFDYALRLFHEYDESELVIQKKSATNLKYKKFLNIHFPYTPYTMFQKGVAPGIYYEIPRNLSEFVCHLHGVKAEREWTDQPQNYLQNPVGEEMALLIGACTKMHAENPDWFTRSHVRRRSDNNALGGGDRDRLSDSPSVSDSGISSTQPECNSSQHSSCGHLEVQVPGAAVDVATVEFLDSRYTVSDRDCLMSEDSPTSQHQTIAPPYVVIEAGESRKAKGDELISQDSGLGETKELLSKDENDKTGVSFLGTTKWEGKSRPHQSSSKIAFKAA